MFKDEKSLLASGRFEDKSDSWLVARKWIHDNPLIARDKLFELARHNPIFLDLIYDFDLWCRPEQFMNFNEENIILLLCGRGYGKSHFASNYISKAAQAKKTRIALWASDLKSAKRVNWLGEAGIIENIHPDVLKQCDFNKTDLTIKFPNGSTVVTYTAESYDRSRGDSVEINVLDEMAAWSYVDEAYNAAHLIMRKGDPRMIITTTPRGLSAIKNLASDPKVKLIKGLTSDNYFLPESYEAALKDKLTERMYRQECLAEILDDNLYALFQMSDILDCRIPKKDFDLSTLRKIVVGIDPATTENENSDLTGIVVCGQDHEGVNYVLEDASMTMASPEQWASKAISLYIKYNKYPADVRLVAESNQGGSMVSSVIKNAARSKVDGNMPSVTLVTATKGKEVRAEPIAAIYERHEARHVGEFEQLEFEMTEWNPTDRNAKSPDRLDALVWALTALTKSIIPKIESGYSFTGKKVDDNGNDAINPYCCYR